MLTESMESLYLRYTNERKISLNKDQFASFVAFFPALLVVACDGIVDKEEWLFCKKLAKGLGNTFSNTALNNAEAEELTQVYKTEFKYLLKNLEDWEVGFLNTLRDYLKLNQYAKEFVIETIYLFADASNGISDEERNKISFLEKTLEL
jgi:tellurite resistance protein